MRFSHFFIIDFWTLWGFIGQAIFTFSFVVQWYKSEKIKKSHLPYEFWILRLIASIMLVIYVIKRRDVVFLVGTLIQILIYVRNIYLIRKHGKEKPII